MDGTCYELKHNYYMTMVSSYSKQKSTIDNNQRKTTISFYWISRKNSLSKLDSLVYKPVELAVSRNSTFLYCYHAIH